MKCLNFTHLNRLNINLLEKNYEKYERYDVNVLYKYLNFFLEIQATQ